MKSNYRKNRWTSKGICFVAGCALLVAGDLWQVAYAQEAVTAPDKTSAILKVLVLTVVIVSSAGGLGAYIAIKKSKK